MIGIEDGDVPVVDDGYDREVDRLEVADCDRGDAAIAVDRERRTDACTSRMRADLARRMTGGPSADQPLRPVSDDFGDGNVRHPRCEVEPFRVPRPG